MNQTKLENPTETLAKYLDRRKCLFKITSIPSYNADPPKVKISNFERRSDGKHSNDIQSRPRDHEHSSEPKQNEDIP